MKDKDVLDIGLGYGSVSQRIAEYGARLTGLDIAEGPVVGVNHRLQQCGLTGKAVQGSILNPPFPPASFDYVVSIGCFHHTGNLPLAIREAARLLRPTGKATIMTYSATSYLQWLRNPARTASYVFSVAFGNPPPLPFGNPEEYDANSKGQAAPETVLLSKTHFERLLKEYFGTVQVRCANAASIYPLHGLPRPFWLKTLGRAAGLDLYGLVADNKPFPVNSLSSLLTRRIMLCTTFLKPRSRV